MMAFMPWLSLWCARSNTQCATTHVQLGWRLQWKQKQNNLRMSTLPLCLTVMPTSHPCASLDTQSHVIPLVYTSIESLQRLTIKGTGYTLERRNASQIKDSQRTTEFAMNYSKLSSLHSSWKCPESAHLRPWRKYASLALIYAHAIIWRIFV